MDLGLAAAASRSQVLPGALRPLISRMPKAQSPWKHAQGGAAGGVAPSGHPSARQLVSPRIEGDLGGALQAGEGHRTHRDARFGQDEPRAVGPGVQQAGDYNANQAHSGRPDASDPGPHQIPGSHGDALRKVQGLALLRGPEGVQDLGGGGSVEELQRFGGPGEVRKVVKGDLIKNEPSPIPTHNLARDPEALATVPPPSMEQLESDSSTWSRVSHRPSRKGRRDTDMEEEHLVTHPKAEMVRLERRLEELKRAEKEKNMR